MPKPPLLSLASSLLFLLAAPLARAQYAVTITGGAWSSSGTASIAGDDDGQGTARVAMVAPTGGGAFDPATGRPRFSAAPGSSGCQGPMVAHLHWTGTGPPPSAVVVKETSVSSWYGDAGGGGCDTGLPNPVPSNASATGETETSVRYTVKPDPGADFDLPAVTPTASASASGGGGTTDATASRQAMAASAASAGGAQNGAASVDYAVAATVPTLTLKGVLDPVNDKRLHIGQRLTATVGGVPVDAGGAFTWGVDKGDPFNKFAPTAAEGKVTPFAPPNAPSMTCFFAKGGRDVEVKCTFRLSPTGVTVTVSNQLTVEVPNVYHDAQSIGVGTIGIEDANNVVTPNRTNPNFFGLYGATYPGRKTWGIFYNFWVEDRPGYASLGQFAFVQLLEDESKLTLLDGTVLYVQPQRGIGVDNAYPYPSEPWKPAGKHVYNGLTQWSVFADRPHLGVEPPPGSTQGSFEQTCKALTYDAKFKLYVLYTGGDDDAGVGDVVPLRLIPWNFVSTATYDGTRWTVADGADNAIKPRTELPPFPEWHQVIRH